MKRILYYSTPGIVLEIEIEEETIMGISFCTKALNKLVESDFEQQIIRQFDEYFKGVRKQFDLPFFATGTPFQLMVWEELLKIPYGKTICYQDLASRIGNPPAQRAVGNALNKNPMAIIIPCHRVIAKSGEIGGFAVGKKIKRMLLAIEHKYGESL
ncbi:MAG: methylated-DNA--[protein]-cysteine S-methyltransferase [Candidatus Cloacimonetes bacterium]|jgi:methylated-DNA-[protein]-cysteine S-methyltransferase|nr:methylated-DNA--[protein]-cysteine S-methyltransferase [Candidatus Cloacimonadota bacterium]MDD2210905.1 methylated-DNA--[protein]-cysteine S-methyltransferase [Candidatus Cloacimonadota bacterium]MDD4232028.1 methylated-DNA--[protein]-cysteine S-methyltransferase [Candidatus Cloacimonadota bacterium]MDD4687415.1 methylated-DNA--[protein]-cysteine S-methyltransferase [Candidatus Cloacimonadota bacterium]MDY0299149.1 methylated-DNA--[protein]-cysteine S-methyltransferase [Candidatus Cloacimon